MHVYDEVTRWHEMENLKGNINGSNPLFHEKYIHAYTLAKQEKY